MKNTKLKTMSFTATKKFMSTVKLSKQERQTLNVVDVIERKIARCSILIDDEDKVYVYDKSKNNVYSVNFVHEVVYIFEAMHRIECDCNINWLFLENKSNPKELNQLEKNLCDLFAKGYLGVDHGYKISEGFIKDGRLPIFIF